jgi:RNA polymerase sigma-70 factor (ECF subfamily)
VSGTADRDQPHLEGRAAPARPRRAAVPAERRGPDATHAALAEVAHAQWYRVVATLMRQTGDLQLAEDAAQDAVTDALRQWPIDGLPVNPAAWLTTVGRRRAIDRLRREQRRTDKEELRHRLEAADRERGGPEALDDDDPDEIADDQLRLLFLCCHPALGHEAQIALTLRAVAGLPTPAIARAFLVPEATMAQRIVRAKRKIALAGIPFRVPEGDLVAAGQC